MQGKGAGLTLFDPLDGAVRPVRMLRAGAEDLVVELSLTDSPRLLTIEEK